MGSVINGFFYTSLKPSVVSRQDLRLFQGKLGVSVTLVDILETSELTELLVLFSMDVVLIALSISPM